MKIIQSYSLVTETHTCKAKNSTLYINLHVFLLSFLTLKKYYGHVTMYCDQNAYDTLIKYIPYDEVIIKENPYKTDSALWSVYKVFILNQMKEPFIHVDTDVFIFDPVFDEFIANDTHDVLVQDILRGIYNPISDFYEDNKQILTDFSLVKDNYVDGFFSCGSVGIKDPTNVLKYSFVNEQIKMLAQNDMFKYTRTSKSKVAAIIEEYSFYLFSYVHNLNVYSILDIEKAIQLGGLRAGEDEKYTHMWFRSKYIEEYVDLIKNKVRKEFPDYSELVSTIDDLITTHDNKYYYKHGPNIEEFYIKQKLYGWNKYEKKRIRKE